MRRMSSVLSVFCIAAAFVCGCTTPQEKPPAPQYMTDAVLQSLADIFDGSWGGVTVYIQKNAWVPEDLRKAGQSPVQVTTLPELMKKQYDLEKSPAMAVIDAQQDEAGIITVIVNYQPVKMKGLEPDTKGGSFVYTFKLKDGKLVKLASTKSLN